MLSLLLQYAAPHSNGPHSSGFLGAKKKLPTLASADNANLT